MKNKYKIIYQKVKNTEVKIYPDYTMDQVSKNKNWIVVADENNKKIVLNVEKFIDKHPGGKIIKDYLNKDASIIWGIHHSQNIKEEYFPIYKIGNLKE